MKKKKLGKDIRKSITKSKGRFISIMLLMMLGSFALVGLFVTGPDMRNTGVNYFNTYNTADITVISDYGIDSSEMEYIEKASGIKNVEYIYLKDVVIENSNTSVRVFSKPQDISLYELKEGELPVNDDEIAIDYGYIDKYGIGDTISFTEKLDTVDSESVLKNHQYKIVGFVYSSEILSSLNRGQTTVGTGELDSYAIVNKANFNSDIYMMAKLTFEDTQGVDPYSDEYTELITKHKEELTKLLTEQQSTRLSVIKQEYQDKIDEAKTELENAKQELEDARVQIADAKKQLDDAKFQISEIETKLSNAKTQIQDAESQITSNENKLNVKQTEYDNSANLLAQKQTEYDSKVIELTKKETELNIAKQKISDAEIEINVNKEKLETGKKQYEDGIATLEQTISKLQYALSTGTLTSEETESYKKQVAMYTATLEKTKSEYNDFINNTYNTGLAKIEENQNILNSQKTELDNGEIQISEAKETLKTAKIELDNGYTSLANAKQTLNSAKTSLAEAKAKLASSKKEYNDGVTKLNNAKTELSEKETEYNTKLDEFNQKEPDAIKEIENAQSDIDKAQEKVDNLDLPTYSVYTRRENLGGEGYKIYATVSEIVDSLAKIFPVFLYFVAALVTLTTMTRFVSEERVNSGTLKSLGYEDKDIIKKFVAYGFIAGMIGTTIGIVLGHTLLPFIVYNAYSSGFTVPKIEFSFYPQYTIIAIILSLCSSVLPAYIVAKKELREKPAELLLPKAPKAGTKILLEKITSIWNRMSFTHKVTARNIFRYKSRMFMTIFGIAGATAVLFTGFSVRSSISKINERQFSNIIKYNMIVAINDDLTESETKELTEKMDSKEIKEYISVYYESASITAGNKKDEEEIKVIVPSDETNFRNYMNLVNRKSKENINFENNGVVISERLAELLNLNIGDSFEYKNSKDESINIRVSGICEMYTGHFIFMNKTEFESVYNKEFKENANLVLLNDGSIENTKEVASELMNLSSVKGIVQNTTLYNQVETIVNSLNKIMTVLIIVAALLGIVIIYNLTNINVCERIRELSTIKVLGFRDKEVTMYIYRETIVLTLIAIIVGWIIGLGLHSYILAVVPPDYVMFNPAQWIGSFVIPFVIISIVSIVMRIYTNNKLKYVDMLEALKSVD